MAMKYIVGDATRPKASPAVIAHVCNDVGVWGKGFVLAVSKRWPEPEASYRHRFREGDVVLGRVHLVDVNRDGIIVANMVAQTGIGGQERRAAAAIRGSGELSYRSDVFGPHYQGFRPHAEDRLRPGRREVGTGGAYG